MNPLIDVTPEAASSSMDVTPEVANPLMDITPEAAPLTPVAGQATRNLQLNSVVLILTNVATGLLGLLFWTVAARLNSAEEIGRASVLITAATLLATLANLSFGPMFERFLVGFGSHAGQFVRFGFMCSTAAALTLGVLLVVLGPRDELFPSTFDEVLFPALVCILAWFALEEQLASALGVARWAGYQNACHSVLKLAVIAVIPGASCAMIVGSWAIPALACSVALGGLLLRRLHRSVFLTGPAMLPPRPEMLAYFGSSYGIQVIGTVAPLTIPLIVMSALGSERTAYFSIAWTLVAAVFLVGSIMVGPFVAEAAAHPYDLHHLLRRFAVLLGGLAVASSLFLGLCAPLVLSLIGPEYRAQGAPLLYYAAAIIPLWVIDILYGAVARIQRRLILAVSAQCLLAVLSIGGSALLVPGHGIAGVGIAYLVASAVTATLVGGPLIRGFRQLALDDSPTLIEEKVS